MSAGIQADGDHCLQPCLDRFSIGLLAVILCGYRGKSSQKQTQTAGNERHALSLNPAVSLSIDKRNLIPSK